MEWITIKENEEAELIEKKSRFIANIFYVDSIEKTNKYIEEIKKIHPVAKHHCFAYKVIEDGNILTKSSDDGEPSGTAGAPILQLIENKKMVNILIIVTRYFGGILLGTGGLCRAYSGSANNVVEKCKIVQMLEGERINFKIPYQDLEKVKYICNKNEIEIVKIEYKEEINVTIEISQREKEKIIEEMQKKQVNVKNLIILNKKYVFKKYKK